MPTILQGVTGSARRLYRDPEVVETLSEMQHGKCCYCEKKIETSGHGQAVEHFGPQSEFLQLSNTWQNLLHACSDCNGAKWNQFPLTSNGAPTLIDPSDPAIDPEDHIDFDVDDQDDVTFARAKAKNDSQLGGETIKTVKLDVVGRRHARASYYRDINRAYVEVVTADEATRSSKISAFQRMLGADHPYAGFARAFARKVRADERFSVRIPAGADLESPH